MLGDYLNNNKRRDVKTREDQVMWMGRKYKKNSRTGYYICTTGKSRKRLHVAVWEEAWGREVPQGCVVHHLDWDKSNNTIENLVCLTVWEHNMVHNKIGGEKGKKWGYELKAIRDRERGIPAIDAMW